MSSLEELIEQAKQCRICEEHLPLGPRPVFLAHVSARILIASQAPGLKVHQTGIMFNDPSGERLRDWMGIGKDIFYDETKIAILPMGFCYPGRGKSGDLPPRPECAPKWRQPFLEHLKNIQLTLVIGKYAMDYHLPDAPKTLTETVKQWQNYSPAIFPLPHPSPRNNIWLKKNSWFTEEVLPELKKRVAEVLA